MLTSGDSQLFDSRAFEARYAGRDPACGEPIEVGERVMYVGTVLVHEACAAEAPAGHSEKPTKFQGTSLDAMGY
jgi:hypothetical protein